MSPHLWCDTVRKRGDGRVRRSNINYGRTKPRTRKDGSKKGERKTWRREK